jgi:hypothetical protein
LALAHAVDRLGVGEDLAGVAAAGVGDGDQLGRFGHRLLGLGGVAAGRFGLGDQAAEQVEVLVVLHARQGTSRPFQVTKAAGHFLSKMLPTETPNVLPRQGLARNASIDPHRTLSRNVSIVID